MTVVGVSPCLSSASTPPLPQEFRFASDSLFPVMKDASRAPWVLERLRPILIKFPRHAPFRHVQFWALAVSGAPASTLEALTDSLVQGLFPVGPPEPPGQIQQATHSLELAQILLARHEALPTAETYARNALQHVESIYQPELRATCLETLIQIRVAEEMTRVRDSLMRISLAATPAPQQAEPRKGSQESPPWDYVRDFVEMLGALATACAVVWAVFRYLRGRDVRTVSRFEANYRSAFSFLAVHMASFQGLASEMVSHLFSKQAPVAERITDIINTTSSKPDAAERQQIIGGEEPNILQWVRFGIGSRAWRARDTWGQTFYWRASRVRLDSALSEQLLLFGAALVSMAYRRQLNDTQVAKWMVEIAQSLVDTQASGPRLSPDQVKVQWSLLLFRRMITHNEQVTYPDVFNPFLQIARSVEEAFGTLNHPEKVARLNIERRMPWPEGGLTPEWLEGLIRHRIPEGPSRARCLERVRQLTRAIGIEAVSPEI